MFLKNVQSIFIYEYKFENHFSIVILLIAILKY